MIALLAGALLAAAPQDRPAPACTPEHAAMGHCAPAAPAPAPPASCTPEHAAMGHCAPTAPTASRPAPTPVPATWADRVWGEAAMAPARDILRLEHGGGQFSQVMIDRLELGIGEGRDTLRWEGEAWFGGDIHRLWLRSEGESGLGTGGGTEVELNALYGRAIGPYFDLQAGIRQDIRSGADPTQAVVGIQGLAPYWFEVEAYLALSTRGDLRADIAAEYDQRLTQRLILQPRVELDLSAQDIPGIGVGRGFSRAEAGLRLRYEIVREVAPYVGISHERALGRTARWRRLAGADTAATQFVAGVRMWF